MKRPTNQIRIAKWDRGVVEASCADDEANRTIVVQSFGERFESVPLECDSIGAVHLTDNNGMKHIVLRFFFVDELVARDILST